MTPKLIRFLKTTLRVIAAPFRWAARIETSGRFVWSLVLADLMLAAGVILFLNGYWLIHRLDAESVALLSLGIVLFHLAAFSYVGLRPVAATWQALKIPAANALAVLVFPLAFAYLQIPLDRGGLLHVAAVLTPLQLLLHFAHRYFRGTAPLEPLRWILLAAGGLLVSFPFLTNSSVGSGDAFWYANMTADFATQWRAGVFPVFAGQSEFAFNGAISPLRLAPYLQHAAGVLDVLTRNTLTFFGLLNLTLVCSLIGGACSAYASLVAIDRGPRWLALLLALLFISSPGVLALAYTGDLFMSVCALPYLPLVLLGLHRTFRDGDTASVCLLATALAAVWLCHPPIAFWLTLVVALGQLIRLGRAARNPKAWRGWLAGVGVFAALTAFQFTSVATLHAPAAIVERSLSVDLLTKAFPAIFQPVSETASELSDYQLGWSLWVVLLAGGVGAIIQRGGWGLTLLLGACYFLLLLLPIPGVLRAMWYALPQAVCNLTNAWPMQRLYVLLAIMAIFLGYAVCANLAARRWQFHLLLAGALAGGLCWSGSEAFFFLQRGLKGTAPAATARVSQLPQNLILTRYAYNPFASIPPYYSHGYIDPAWENRLLEPDSFREIASNYRALSGAASTVSAEGAVTARHYAPQSTFYELFAALPVEPGRHYALELTLSHPELSGSLLVAGSTVVREYYLPHSGVGVTSGRPPTSFGALPTSKRSFPLLSSAPQTEKLLVQFVSSTLIERDVSDFGRYALREYDPARLPIVIESWVPYRAKVTSPARAWLETPRIFTEGYRATVNGQPVPVKSSPDGLVMLPVEAGESRVKLTYPGTLSLRLGYFLSLAAWLGVFAAAVLHAFRARRPATAG